jgi:hypothetical protein
LSNDDLTFYEIVFALHNPIFIRNKISTTFLHSLHILQQENKRLTFWKPVVVVLVLLAWLLWFLWARLPLFATATSAQMDGDHQVAATFPLADARYLELGQPAQIRLDDFQATDYEVIPATVTRIDPAGGNGRILVTFTLSPQEELPVPSGPTGQVTVEIDRLSPAAMLLRAIDH